MTHLFDRIPESVFRVLSTIVIFLLFLIFGSGISIVGESREMLFRRFPMILAQCRQR